MRMDTALTDKGRQHPVGNEPSRPVAADQQRDWRERGRADRQRLIELNDVFHAVTFVAAEIVARAVPERHWRAFAGAFARASLAVRRRRADCDAELLDACLAGHMPDDLDPRALVASIIAASFEERVFFRKAAHDPAWRPDVRLEGREQLDAALAGGRGAVLWVAPMIFSTLLVKTALHDAGYRVAHLSVAWHGLARTRFGRWLVNARGVAVEQRFVERVVIPAEGRAGAVLKELGRRLCRNEVVTIRAVGNANRPIEAPFLGGRLRLGPGAPRLALAHRAPLLAAITGRDDAGGFCVTLRLLSAADAGGPDGNPIERLAHAFTEAYARGVFENPALWNRISPPRQMSSARLAASLRRRVRLALWPEK
jgi:lauroyl/myristoyl acyltransferase